MKKIRILSGLMVVVMLLSLMAVNVFAADSGKVVLSDVPYDYGVVRFSDDWDELTISERKSVFTISESIAENLTTEALLKTILNNPFVTEIFMYDNIEVGISNKDSKLQFSELFSRNDIENVLENYIEELFVKLPLDFKVDSIASIDKIEDEDLSIISEYVICNSLYSYLNMKNIEHENNLRYSVLYVPTVDGQLVRSIVNRTWSNVVGGELAISLAEINYENNYPNSIKLQDKSPIYNCHCYAWHTNYALNDLYVWIESEDAVVYLNESTCYERQSPEVGTQVVYFKSNGEMLHTGFVTGIQGSNIYVVSKLGNCGVYRHLLQDCSYYEESAYIKYYVYG